MGIDAIVFEEAIRLTSRNSRYLLVALPMYIGGLYYPRESRIFKAMYFFARHIDDVLDGDRLVHEDPEKYVLKILAEIRSGNPGSTPKILELYKYVIRNLAHFTVDGDDPWADFERLIAKAMLYDYYRSKHSTKHKHSPKKALILSREELEQYYEDTFYPILNLALMVGKAQIRAEDVKDLVSTQGHLYSIRDMGTDLSRNIVNIPKEELEASGMESGLEIDGRLTYGQVRANPYLVRWIDKEIKMYKQQVEESSGRLLGKFDTITNLILWVPIRSMLEICNRYKKRII